MKKLIEFKNVNKTYKMGEITINALDNVSFEINEGEFVVLLGASGAGKTTVLNLLGGMDKVSGGEIIVDGSNIENYSDKQLTEYRRKNIGFVFQFYNLIANLNALENVEFASAVTANHLDAKDILSKVGLGERLKNFPSQLSGGEQQRVAIARAIAKNPLLLLCDEPTGALDFETGKRVLKLLIEINKLYNKTVVLITHNAALGGIGDRIIRMGSGKIVSVSENAAKTPIEEILY